MITIETSIRDAARANEIINDLPLDAGDFSHPSSNTWIIPSEDIAFDVLQILIDQEVEIINHEIPEMPY